MRLIDADRLLEEIENNDNLPFDLNRITKMMFKSVIDAQPTAYNVDKCMKEISRFPSAYQYYDICGKETVTAVLPKGIAMEIIQRGFIAHENQ